MIVECYKDKALVHRIGFLRGDQVMHEFGRSRVLGTIEDEEKIKGKAIAIIDKDPQADDPECLQEEYTERDTIGKLRLFIRKNGGTKRIVQISPRLEDWLYGIAGRNKISPERFDLPNDPEELHNMSLRLGKNMANFQRFLDALRRAKDDEINTLRRWIREAIE